jgi:hypothetical protein
MSIQRGRATVRHAAAAFGDAALHVLNLTETKSPCLRVLCVSVVSVVIFAFVFAFAPGAGLNAAGGN